MISDGLVEPSVSAWNSPLLVVSKKPDEFGNKKYRAVIDYRNLNKCIQDDKFPLPNITYIIDRLGKATNFSCLDLSQGYYQVELDKHRERIIGHSLGSKNL